MPVLAHTNRLINEKSPYLLQHAHNPVDWYPWGNEAFAKAKAEGKPVFLSIGYSCCHWCHVMEHESFEDEEVARALNQNFVSIKVDREERPDVDTFYMDACVALNGNGGWPLSCFLTHDRKPFFAGTYFPKEDGLHGTGFLTVLSQIDGIWRRRRSDIFRSADEISRHVGMEPKGTKLKPAVIDLAYQQLEKRFDDRYGGFGGAPKFPSLQNLLFLSLYGVATQSQRALDMLRKTLDCMANGGIYDQIGGGFCRYSTDHRWLVPHFEKMMVDNALHILVYAQAAALFGDRYADIAKHTIDFCTREMLNSAGGFYTAMDADSEGVEGKFYVFTPREIENALGENDGQRYCRLYHITPSGNFEDKNIPNLIDTGLPEQERDFAQRCNEKLLQYRSMRVPPFRDEKVTAMVNGLMIAALATAGRILGVQSYIDTARRCADFALTQLVIDGRLMNRWRAGEAGIPGNCDDYACLIWGLTELYAATFEPRWLIQAVRLTDQMDTLFGDQENGGYYLTGSDVDDLPVRQKNIHDGAMPSGNAIMALNLTRLSRLCANARYAAGADQIITLAAPILNSQPATCCGLMPTLLYLEDGGRDIILVNGEGFDALRDCLPASAPFTSVAVCGENYEDILTAAPYLRDYKSISGKATAYVCKNGACGRPETSPDKFKALLSSH